MIKVLKILGAIILVLGLIFVFGSYFLPKKSRVERSIMVGVNDSVAYSYVLDFKKFNEWSPWFETDPTAKVQISGVEGEVGEKYAWFGKDVGEGNFEVTKLEPYSAIYQKLTFLTPFKATADNNFLFYQEGDSTKVTWFYEGENIGIFAKWMGLSMDRMIGNDYEKGLIKLKVNLEKK